MDFAIFDHVYDSVLVYNKSGLIIYCNESFSGISGISANRIIGKMDLSKVFTEIEGCPVNKEEFVHYKEATNTRVIRYKTKNISDGLAQFSIVPMMDGTEKVFAFILKDLSVEEDLHKKYRREMSLKDKKIEEMNSLIQLLQRTRMVKEPRKILEEFLKHILSQYGLATGFIKDEESRVHKIPEKAPLGYATMIDTLLKKISEMQALEKYTVFSHEMLAEMKLGHLHHCHSLVGIPVRAGVKSAFEIYIPMPNAERANGFDQDRIITLTQQMALVIDNMKLERLSIVDDLTKLYNARHFREKLDEYTAKYKNLSMILTDIDFFKKINDTYGHPGGDAVLQRVGAILKHTAEADQQDNIVFRVGGEEFSILVPEKDEQETSELAEKIANKIRQEVIPFDGKDIKITMSFGVSKWLPGKIFVRDFYTRADQALYSSKKNGRDRITIYSETKS